MNRAILEGIRVIEFGLGGVVPTLTKQLGDFGAQVIKIESRKRPDTMRGQIPELIEKGVGFAVFHRNKLDVTIDLSRPQGIEVVRRLVRVSDVVAENFSFGVMAKLGLDYENLKQIKSDIIMIGQQGQGATGPRRSDLTWGPNLMPLVSLTYLWNHPGIPEPVGSQIFHPDYFAGLLGCFAVLCALDYRRRTGEGQYIDAAEVEAAALLLGPLYADFTINRRIPLPVGNCCPYTAPYGCYRCQGEDSWCVIAVYTDEEWRNFCDAIGNPPWTRDPRFATLMVRLEHREELDRLVEEWTRNYSPQDVMAILQKAGVAAGAVQSSEDVLLRDRHLRERGFLMDIEHPMMGTVTYEGIPIKLSETPGSVRSPAPLLGQHTEYVCSEILGMTQGEIEELTEKGVLF